jgi:hypothetical protein
VLTRPCSSVAADPIRIEDFLRGGDDLVDRRPTRVGRVGVAARLHRKHFR